MQNAQGHSSGRVAGEALNGHVGHDIGAVFYVRSLTERRIRAGNIVMVSAHHHRSDLAFSYQLVETQGDAGTSLGILIEYPCLSTYYQLVCLGVPDPYPVVPVLRPAVRIYAVHGRLVGGVQIFRLAGEAYP